MNFNENGYYIIRNFLDPDFVKFIQSYFYTKIRGGQAITGDIQAPHSYCIYGDSLMDTVLINSMEAIEKITERKLLPTYSYTRLYGCGDELVNHLDRPSCELSATIALGIPDGEKVNPIYFSKKSDKSNSVKIELLPGDLCLYRGCDLYHWRDPFTQKWCLQSFLHYVDANGPNKNNIYDGRYYLGLQK